jgi:ectoine hydroxylase-related dioxygenase (phytanoyl-CoA dioxygenase family)
MSYIPFIESRVDDAATTLRGRMFRHGYVFVRQAVPAAVVIGIREQILALCAKAGWLNPAFPPREAVANTDYPPTTEGKPDYMAVYKHVLKLPDFHALPEHPTLISVASKLLDHPHPFVHPRRIGRMTFPNYQIATTPPHQDHFYIRGAIETYSCWMPLGAVPESLGGLAVWPGSHRLGFREHNKTIVGAVGGRGVDPDALALPDAPVWHSTDFEPGDALFFHAYTVHKALPNLSGSRMRISTDNRYQRPEEAIEPGALRPHFDL